MTRIVYGNGVIELIADSGMVLANDNIFSDRVLVGLHGNETLWEEISSEEAERRKAALDDPELTDEEVLDILLGGDVNE